MEVYYQVVWGRLDMVKCGFVDIWMIWDIQSHLERLAFMTNSLNSNCERHRYRQNTDTEYLFNVVYVKHDTT